MNHDTIKAKIQELVPELMELSFGCRFSFKNRVKDCVALSSNEWKHLHFWYQKPMLEPDYDCLIRKDVINEIEILGHPIQLQHVLRAIGKMPEEPILVDQDGLIQYINKNHQIQTIKWNLAKDFDGQSDATKEFIGELLG